MDVNAIGFDTLVYVLEAASPIPITDEAFQDGLVLQGFKRKLYKFRDHRTKELVTGIEFVYQSEDKTYRVTIRDPWHVKVEVSAARLHSKCAHNLGLVSAEEAYALIEQLAERILSLIPEAESLELLKFLRADFAIDLYTESKANALIKSLSDIQLNGSRKLKRATYRGEGIENRGATQSLVAYRKGVQLRSKLRGKDLKTHTALICELIEKGLVRIEYRYHPKGGAPATYLNDAAKVFAGKLESGLPNGKIKVAGGFKALVDFVDGLEELSHRQQDAIIADMVRERVYDDKYTANRHSPRTLCRRAKVWRILPAFLAIDEEDDEIDLGPTIELLKAA